MTRNLIVVLPLAGEDPWIWGMVEDGLLLQYAQANTEIEKAALATLNSGKCTAVLPGQDVVMFTHELPQARRSDTLKAAIFSVEDQLAAPANAHHIILGQGADNRVAVTAKDRFSRHLQRLASAGLSPEIAIADFDSFAEQAMAIRAFDRLIVPGRLGMTLDEEWGGELPPDTVIEALDDGAALTHIAAHLATYLPLNFRQGEFAKPGRGWNGLAMFGRAAALLAVLGLGLLLWNVAQSRALIKVAAANRAEMARLYTKAMGEPAPGNIALAVTRQLHSPSGSSAAFLELSQILFDGVALVDGVKVETMYFDSSRTVIQLRLIYPSFASASALEAAIVQVGGYLRSGGVRESNGAFIGDAEILLEPGA